MKTEIFNKLNKSFEHRIRLAIMSLLVVEEKVKFHTLKKTLNITDGNLAGHIAVLEKAGYLIIYKEFAGKKPVTSYAASSAGKIAFKEHLNALESIIKLEQINNF